MKSHHGNILLKEKYGSSAKERYFVKPPDQLDVVVYVNEKYNDVATVFSKIFLPQGYPDSVSKDYIAYQKWDTAQAFCSTITGILATQEVLRGVGVGDTTATPLAATVTWVIKDGCGHLGKILFAYSHGTYLDAYSKKWRLYADILNDAAMCIEIALPVFSNYVTFALCVSTVMKAIVGVAGGATRAAMTQHHAVRGNMADVAAKDSAQETAVNLIASITALFIISTFGNSLFIFILMLILHVVFNYLAVRAVCLKTLNEPRFIQVIETYLKKEIVASPCEINKQEPIIFYQLGPMLLDLKICGFKIILGGSMTQTLKQSIKEVHLKKIKKIYCNKNYILFPNTAERNMYIFFKDGSVTDDILCAYFHAVQLSIIICAINDCQLPMFQNNNYVKSFAQLCKTLQSADWSRTPGNGSDFRYEPSYELLSYFHKIATNQWKNMRAFLIRAGWDLSKHLLMVDEWRVFDENVTKETSPDNTEYIMYSPDSIPSDDFKENFTFSELELLSLELLSKEHENDSSQIKKVKSKCISVGNNSQIKQD